MDESQINELKYQPVEKRAITILKDYSGNNNFLLILKNRVLNGETTFGRKISEYVVKNYDKKVIGINKWYNIDGYCGEELQKKFLCVEKPTKIYIQKLLSNTDKAIHIWGKIWEDDKCVDLWIPKHSIIKPKAINKIEFSEDHWDNYERKPYKYQIEGIIKLLENDRFILADDCGLGKSYESIVASIESKSEKILIVCPASLKLNWKKEIEMLESTRQINIINGSEWISGGKWTIVNYDILKNFHTVPDKRKKDQLLITTIVDENFDIIIGDECFTYNTLVTTEFGQMKIGDIVENNLNVQILSYNLKTNKLEHKKIIRWIKNETSNRLLKIKTNNGLIIECTPNHKIFIKNEGYVKANKIKPNDTLFGLSEGINQAAKIQQKQTLFDSLLIQRSGSEYTNIKHIKKKKATNYTNLSRMWNRIYKKTVRQKTILLSILFSKRDNETAREICKDTQRNSLSKVINYTQIDFSKKARINTTIIRPIKKRSANVKTGRERKNDGKNERPNIFISWWKRSDNQTTKNNIRYTISDGSSMDVRVSNKNKRSLRPVSFFTLPLFARYCSSRIKNINRNRWKYPQNEKMEIFGSSQNGSVKCVRVESVEVLEQRSRSRPKSGGSKNTTVYNLEINDNHNYFANNILVSNCHYTKNQQSQRAKIFNDLSKNIKRVWLLTGTPVTNRPIDLYNLLALCKHRLARSWMGYVIRYCAGKQFYGRGGRKIWDTKGASNLEELHNCTQDVILRRRKEDILDLPEKIVQPIYLPLQCKEEYQKIVGEYQTWADHQKTVNLALHLSQLVKLRQFLALSKVEFTIEIVENAIEEGKKVVIFTNFTEPLLQLHNHFGKMSVIHHGPMSKNNREESIERFQNDPNVKVFIGNIISAGVGITLTAAELVVFNDLSWLPADHLQAQDRCYRIGTKKVVNVYYNIVSETLDLHLYHALMKKIKVIDQVMGDSNLDDDIFKSVIQKLKK